MTVSTLEAMNKQASRHDVSSYGRRVRCAFCLRTAVATLEPSYDNMPLCDDHAYGMAEHIANVSDVEIQPRRLFA